MITNRNDIENNISNDPLEFDLSKIKDTAYDMTDGGETARGISVAASENSENAEKYTSLDNEDNIQTVNADCESEQDDIPIQDGFASLDAFARNFESSSDDDLTYSVIIDGEDLGTDTEFDGIADSGKKESEEVDLVISIDDDDTAEDGREQIFNNTEVLIADTDSVTEADTENNADIERADRDGSDNTEPIGEESSIAENTGSAEDEEQPIEKSGGVLSFFYDWLEVLTVSVALVFIIFAFVARVAIVDGESMNNTLQNGDKLLVQELFYTPEAGDIVVCQSEHFGFEKPLVKRVIATAGQTVKLDTENWKVYVDGKELDEPYILKTADDMHGWDFGEEYVVPEGKVFVMGDNRNGSADSRNIKIGAIDERYVVGKVIFRFMPFSSLGTVD